MRSSSAIIASVLALIYAHDAAAAPPCDSHTTCRDCASDQGCHFCAVEGFSSRGDVDVGFVGVCAEKQVSCASMNQMGTLGNTLDPDFRVRFAATAPERCTLQVGFPKTITNPNVQTCPDCVAANNTWCRIDIDEIFQKVAGGGCVTPSEASSFCHGEVISPFGKLTALDKNCRKPTQNGHSKLSDPQSSSTAEAFLKKTLPDARPSGTSVRRLLDQLLSVEAMPEGAEIADGLDDDPDRVVDMSVENDTRLLEPNPTTTLATPPPIAEVLTAVAPSEIQSEDELDDLNDSVEVVQELH